MRQVSALSTPEQGEPSTSTRPCPPICRHFYRKCRPLCQAVNYTLILTGLNRSCITQPSKRADALLRGERPDMLPPTGVGNRDLMPHPASRLVSVAFMPRSC